MGLRKGQYPANFGEAHSNGTLFNAVTGLIFFGPLVGFIVIGFTASFVLGIIAFIVVEYFCIQNDDCGFF